ncbi:RadC family protein [Variovorax ginsengisoli]|uniref:DNA repair protein RadC n=1 Tax=Variovorax ginsengisoli TaxID=363844 RepID=A0ABT9SDK9_9BURK|nr:DNA repair protein RadC [Variovorax ginsengisoli]MDP9902441.1 DNA repair protein RadC [Variovorax ginsengisoli]
MSQYSLSFETAVGTSVLMVGDATGQYRPAAASEVLRAAQDLLIKQLRGTFVLDSPKLVQEYLKAKLGMLEHEVFSVLMLDSQHRLIEYVELFRGTVSQTSVYPREVIKESLARNAAALILVHNHPSGIAEPSRADELLTQNLKTALFMIDVRVLDHIIVAGNTVLSMAQRGLV